ISGSGVDLERFQRKNNKNKKSEVNFILVARMLYDKGIREYIEAAKIVKKSFKNAVFHLLGDIDKGNPSAIPIEIINTWSKQGIVNYYGMVEDVVPFLENADVFVLPSYREGLSRSIIEAMSMELPIITTDVPGCRETVIEKENGLLVKPNNVNDLVEAMIFMINNPDIRLKMGKMSRLIAQNKFDVQQINKEYLSYLDQLW
nr:glycosyltransferase family 4 protein [Candidatus Neomarinimicrobiota bacterium]